ncbi:MAG: hypothetical protein CVT98_06990, partial [Bacteroidetes bacterium HGW-Bacteroidetes-15]
MSLVNCTFDDNPNYSELNSSTDVLLVKKFKTAPIFDGDIDEVWSSARPMLSDATVSKAGNRVITLNGSSNGNTALEPTDLFDPYTGESYKYSLRGGHDGEYLYLLFEFDDAEDSMDRESFYFDPATKTWKQEDRK